MNTLRTAAQQALEALEGGADSWQLVGPAIDALKAALAEEAMQRLTAVQQEIEAALAEPVEFDHGIGDDRFKVVRGAYWYHVLIGDGTKKYGKFHTQAGAEEMATLLLREFKNGAFVQHRERCREGPTAALMADPRAALAEPAQEPVAWMLIEHEKYGNAVVVRKHKPKTYDSNWWTLTPIYTAPQRKPLTDEEIHDCFQQRHRDKVVERRMIARAIERAHGIGGSNG